MTKLKDLQGLGPKSEQMLNEAGIHNEQALRELGAIGAYMRLAEHNKKQPSLNFLYALVGAIEGEHWLHIAQNEKEQLIMALDGYQELQKMINRQSE